MIQYMGWLNLSQSTNGEDEDGFDSTLAKIRRIAEDSFVINENFTFCGSNGQIVLHMSGSHNHEGTTKTRLVDFIKYICYSAKGTYGIVYYWNDEDKIFNNEFQIFRVARGIMTIQKDSLLSPCLPTIED